MRSFFLIVGLVVAMSIATPAVLMASAHPRPGEYTYQQALELGLTSSAEWQRPPGMPVCPPIEDPFPGLPDGAVIPSNAPECWMPPEDQGLVFLVLPPGDPGFGVFPGFGVAQDPSDASDSADAVVPTAALWPFGALALLGVYPDVSR
jgi:hypothetical protein